MNRRILNPGRKMEAFRKDTRGELDTERAPVIIAIVTAAGFLVWMAANTLFA